MVRTVRWTDAATVMCCVRWCACYGAIICCSVPFSLHIAKLHLARSTQLHGDVLPNEMGTNIDMLDSRWQEIFLKSLFFVLAVGSRHEPARRKRSLKRIWLETMSSSLHAWLSETGGGLHPNICFTQGAIYRRNLLVGWLPYFLDASGSRVIASDHLPKDLTIVSCPFSLAITQPVAQRAVLESLQIPISENIQWSERQWISTYISLHWIIPSEDNNR